MKSAITICLVKEAAAGPFVFHTDLAVGCAQAAQLGFDAVEIFPPQAKAVNVAQVKALLKKHRLQVAAVGTGAGWLRHKLSLTSADRAVRTKAIAFIRSIVDLAAEFQAPAIIGSMQGKVEAPMSRAEALDYLAAGLEKLSARSTAHGTTLLYEPLNRYETNLFNQISVAADWLQERQLSGVKILADLFHMNIEETNVAAALRAAGAAVGHVHFADSNRRAIGLGHTKIKPIMQALRAIKYTGYLSAEILPAPTALAAAQQTMASFRQATAGK
ncbi:MAG: TIM barrel protein [Planctomycetota bacterium]